MDPIRSLCTKLRSVAVTLDRETTRLQRALEGKDSDFEDYAVRILNDLHSEVRTLKILSKYNTNLATTPVAVKTMPPSKAFLTRCEGQNS
ncbi:spindle and kinetochore associated complex subunit 3 [Phyllostomus discolor]|uniref:Spindle and kinetochore associated complex subunit 3 n=1 Tax=Phyllostomus discolor TaxID=89673 RepID=A0A834ELW2_9CHIR|nr:spindle and kinetochore associated complex subunit 3 [Phyllostomus discolor]